MVITFQIFCAILMLLLINFVGKSSRGLGYVNMSDILGSGDLGLNFAFRILSPSIFISVLSIILYKLNLNFLVKNIWLVVLFYIIISFLILVILNRWSFVNKKIFLITNILTLIIAYWFYSVALSRGLEFILPESSNFRTEIWFIIIFYFYNLFSNYTPNYESFRLNRTSVLKKKFNYFNYKYKSFITKEFVEDKILNRILFSIMIFEDINRSKIVRFIEKIFFPLGFVKTTGIMQVSSNKFLTDEESIRLAQEKILQIFNQNKEYSHDEYNIIRLIAFNYNDSRYADNIIDIYHEIKYD